MEPTSTTALQIAALQQTLEILSKTNEALNQSWTPIIVILAALAAFFTLVTILAAAVFAYGYLMVKKAKEDRERAANELSSLASERQALLSKLENEANQILTKLDSKGESMNDLQKELKNFMKSSEKAIQRFNDKTLVTVSGLVNTPSVFAYQPSFDPSKDRDAKVCSSCGVVFYEKGGFSVVSSNTYRLSAFGKVLCNRCKKEPQTSVFDY